MDIVTFEDRHVEAAADLVCRRYRELRGRVAQLPQRYERVDHLAALLQSIRERDRPGIVALDKGRVIGLLAAWVLPDFRGQKSIYSPEWANGAEDGNSQRIYEEMYREAAAGWVAEGYGSHYITTFAVDLEALDTWHWLGFGKQSVDAVRGLEFSVQPDPSVEVRRAGEEDLDSLLELDDGLVRHARESPGFFIADDMVVEDYIRWIRDPGMDVLLARVDGTPAALLVMGVANTDVCTIIQDPGTTSIYRAYTQPELRSRGAASALITAGFTSAREAGYLRCAVDFETSNTLASRFWLGQDFRPVCYSLFRPIDERVR